MSFEEKGTWVYLLVTVGTYAAYATIILGRTDTDGLVEVPYVSTMLWAIGIAIGLSILGHIAIAIASPKDADKKDERDRQIYRFGEFIGQSFIVIGGVGAMVLAMVEADHFWIANTLYLTFALSSVIGSVAKIVAYRRGLPSW